MTPRVLVVGADSYIACAFEQFARERYHIQMVDSHNNAWQAVNFTGYTDVLMCAGIAHNPRATEALYNEINRDLPLAVAQKAKNEGVSRFIFLSSMAVYGRHTGAINSNTPANPADPYGASKYAAEQGLTALVGSGFNVCILRPPMVYGKGCKGNFPRLVGLAHNVFLFPNFPNRRSMICIDNLCACLCGVITHKKSGIILPQNSEYISTTELVRLINPQLTTTRLFNPLIRLLLNRVGALHKMFGDLYYVQTGEEVEYNVVDFATSVMQSTT